MRKPIRRAAVIGAGVMGSGIAAHLANAGVEVLLLDIVPPELDEAEKGDRAARNRFAAGGLEKALKARPAAFFHKDRARLVSIGNIEDDLGKLADVRPRHRGHHRADRAQARALREAREGRARALHRRLEHARACASPRWSQGRSRGASSKRFLVMHFFNPVRYMKLLELVAGPGHVARDARPRPPLRRGRARQGHRRRQGHAELRRQPHRRPRHDGDHPPDARGRPRAGGRRRHHRRADGPPEERELPHRPTSSASTPSSTSPTTASRRSPSDEERKVFEVPAYIRAMVEKKLLGDKTQGRLLQARARTARSRRSIPKTLEYRAAAAATRRSARRDQGARARSRTRRSACGSSSPTPGKAGRVRVEGALAGRSPTRRAASARSPTTSSRDR